MTPGTTQDTIEGPAVDASRDPAMGVAQEAARDVGRDVCLDVGPDVAQAQGVTGGLAGGQRRVEVLARLAAAVDEVTLLAGSADGGDPALVDYLASVHQAVSRLSGSRAILTDVLARSGRWREQGAKSLTRFLTHALGILPGTARDMAKLGKPLNDHLPAVRRGVLSGEIDLDHARLTATHTSRTGARAEALTREVEVEVEVLDSADGDLAEDVGTGNAAVEAGWWAGLGLYPEQPGTGLEERQTVTVTMCGEEHLALLASQFRAEDYRKVLAHWCARNDPEGLEDSYREAEEREFVDLAKTMGGYHLGGFLTETTGQLLKTALESVHTPPASGDERNASQRRAGDLAEVARRFLNQGLGGTNGNVRPHLAVAVSFETLKQLAAAQAGDGVDLGQMTGSDPARWQDGSGPIPHTLLAQLACDGDVARYVFGPDSQIINVGRETRFFNRAQRRALEFRDGRCAFPGCSAPASWCDGHHVLPYARGGATDLANGALLCQFHHRMFHRKGYTMRRENSGQWRFYRRSGQQILPQLARLRR